MSKQPWIDPILQHSSIGGRFEKLRSLSTPTTDPGYFSLVFEPWDKREKRNVVPKFFDPNHNGDPYRTACFERDCKLLEALSGRPNILPLVAPRSNLIVHLAGLGNQRPNEFKQPLANLYYVGERFLKRSA